MGTFVPQSDGDHNVVSPSLARLGEEIKAGEIDGILHGVYEPIIFIPCIIYPLYTIVTICTPIYTRYTCIHTIYTP